MPNTDADLQQQYQDILNKYASSLDPISAPVELSAEPQIIIPEPVIAPVPESTSVPISAPVELSAEPQIIIPEPVIAPVPEFPISIEPVIDPPIYFPPEPEVEKSSNIFKYLFFLSLLIFIGVAIAVIYNFSNSQQPVTNLPSVLPTATSSKVMTSAQSCEVGDKKYTIGESFTSPDGCNVCACGTDLTIDCTQKVCVSPTTIPTPKVVTKTYKDIKYKYQFECPTTAKYILEATSVNGNKIPYKQESCTLDDVSSTVSTYDNTVIHSFDGMNTIISLDKKFIVVIDGPSISNFKFIN